MNIFRLQFRWERLQHSAFAGFDATELGRLDNIVGYITTQHAYVILDPHNYARYYGSVIGQGVDVNAFADFWSRLAQHYKDEILPSHAEFLARMGSDDRQGKEYVLLGSLGSYL